MNDNDDQDAGRRYAPRQAGINSHDCPAKSKLVEALLRGESPEVAPPRRHRKVDRRWGDPRIFHLGMRRWVPAT